MSAHQAAIDVLKVKVAEVHGEATTRVLIDIENLQRSLSSIGAVKEPDTALRMPYSSMPNLASMRWK